MSELLVALPNAIILELTRLITGRLFSEDQIRAVTKGTLGKYLVDFFPEPTEDRAARERAEEAREHIEAASSILSMMQSELSEQVKKLDQIIVEVDEKQKIAERYEELALTNKKQFDAYRQELSEAIREEIESQANKGRRLRQIASLAIWLFTLIVGAWLGTYFKEVVEWLRSL